MAKIKVEQYSASIPPVFVLQWEILCIYRFVEWMNLLMKIVFCKKNNSGIILKPINSHFIPFLKISIKYDFDTKHI